MKLYVMRHGPAEDESLDGSDGSRALTQAGRDRVIKVAKRLQALGETPKQVVTSPLVRSVQTGEILLSTLALPCALEVSTVMAPRGDALEFVRRAAKSGRRRLLVVGHEPDVSILCASLLGAPLSYSFMKGMIVSLRVPDGTLDANKPGPEADATLRFVLDPKSLEALGGFALSLRGAAVPQRHELPHDVVEAYGLVSARRLEVGLINQTFRARTHLLGPEGVGLDIIVQRLHPVFAPSVNLDIEAVTTFLARSGQLTPTLVRTRSRELCVESGGHTYRALSYVNGRTLTQVSSEPIAFAAGELAGRFHRALATCDHEFVFCRPHAHDTARHLSKLEAASLHAQDEAKRLAEDILAFGRQLSPLPEVRQLVLHGDLKISNLLFEHEADRGLALVDLDTMGRGNLCVELGDALRSWCSPQGESHGGSLSVPIFQAALLGYRASGMVLDPVERDAVVLGFQTLATELSSRFALDAIEDHYFGWDATRFPSRRAHNLVRAKAQLSLARAVLAQRAALEKIVGEVFADSRSDTSDS